MPTELGGYRVEDRLGVGGMGEVYRAHDESLDRAVAIKLIRPSVLRRHPSGLGKVRQRFRREARAAARLNHPAIVQIYHVLDTSHGDALVMELVEGRSLADLISEGPMEPARAAALGRRIAEGLAEAHAKGIVHRDLKPANVMVDENDRVKILDFGLAKAFETSDGRSSGSQVLTGAGFVIGSYDTMSPEQARGEAIGPASDLFSLGILLYSLLTGHRPFWGTSPMATLTQICIEPHRPIAERAEGVPEGLARLVDRLLEKEPENRPLDAATAAAELARWSEEANGASSADSETLVALVALDLVGREDWWEDLGEGPAARLLARHDAGVAELTASHEGEAGEIDEGHLVLFSRPTRAVRFALDYQRLLDDLSADAPRVLTGRVAIHFGELTLWRIESGSVDPLDDAARVEGTARAVVEGVLGLASPGQVLITRGAFDLARDAGLDSDPGGEGVRWMAHGDYLVEGADGPVSLYEVGLEGRAPLAPPDSSRAVEALTVVGRETILGWRPAAGQEVPGRDHWRLARHLGDGGFGEVWLARHRKTGEARVFKFCFEAERLRALQREITLFRLLKEELGERDDIARILDWRLDAAPYYVESEYTEGGSLVEWTAARGDLRAVPLAERLELAAQVADALAAAHSVGVLHKDVKPGNILVSTDGRGHPRARLADFGVGAVTDRERLRRAGITLVGLTHFETSSGSAGGTRLYEAPEVLEGKTPTVQGDVYALGVVLYQLAVGDLSRALGPGWERDLDDDLLREDIASAVDVDPRRRVEPAALAERLRHLDERREERRAAAREREEADRIRSELQRTRRRRRFWATMALVALVFGVAMTWQSVLTQREARRANREAETARQVSAFLERLFADTDPWLSSLGEEPTVRELIDRGTARLEDDLHDQPLVRARLLRTIGNVYIGLGAYRDAVGVLDSARQSLQRSRPDSPEMVEILLALGEANVQAGEIAASEAALEQALELAENLAEEAPLLRLHAYDSLGFFQIQTDRPVEAEASVERLLAAIEALPASELPAGVEVRLRTRALVRLAHVREMEDRRDDAVVLLSQALDVIEGAGAEAGVGIDDGFNDAVIVALELAHAQVAAGQLDEGEKLLASTREVMERRLDPDRPFFAAVEAVDGLLQLRRGRPSAAKECFADALERVDNAQLSEAFAVLPLLGLGLASEAEGEADEALGYYRRLHRLAQRPDISGRHPSVAEGLGRYAALLRRKGLDVEAAEVELLLTAGPEPGG